MDKLTYDNDFGAKLDKAPRSYLLLSTENFSLSLIIEKMLWIR